MALEWERKIAVLKWMERATRVGKNYLTHTVRRLVGYLKIISAISKEKVKLGNVPSLIDVRPRDKGDYKSYFIHRFDIN